MSAKAPLLIEALATFVMASAMLSCSRGVSQAPPSDSWNRKAAATYLDSREAWWAGWVGSSRDHGTFCVSCHTALPYALARPALRPALAEDGLSANERTLVDNVTKRVRLWKDTAPYYKDSGYDGKASESRGTEAVLNALILANYDAESGQLSDDTRTAFDNMWALQKADDHKGAAWPWLQFDLEPWEARDSQYYGAALAAVAVGTAPGYRSTPAIQHNLELLGNYLNDQYSNQSTLNRVVLLWASARLPGLITQDRRNAIIGEVLSLQQADGGWKLPSPGRTGPSWKLLSLVDRWTARDGIPPEGTSDGYATGLITFALQQAGVPRENAQVQKGLSWLVRNQNAASGLWPSYSPNKRRNPSSEVGHFMSDAATAYAVMALTESKTPAQSGHVALR